MSENLPPASPTSTTKEDKKEQLQQSIHAVAEQRDRKAFEVIFDHFAPLLRSFSLAREPGASLAADELAQIVLIKVWDKAHTYDPQKASLTTWVYTLARNTRIDLLRRNGRYCSDIDPEFLWAEQEDESTDPFLAVQDKRAEQTIAEAFKGLPKEQQEVIKKVYLEGKTHQESSEELRLPLGTVKSRVRLALKKLHVLVRR
ncbi:MAG: RNA polymerase sigma factor (sigma-70 family) [Lentisphaeria bacterium]|jgi:RNA polymerase sigma factor (sigma-70 family)